MTELTTFGKRLRQLRKQSGLTQEELAHQSGFSIMTIRRWEWGERNPRIEEAARLAEVLHVQQHQLLSGDAQPNSWVLTVHIAHDLQEVISMGKNIPRESSIITNSKGGFLCLGGDYSLWLDDNNFKNLLKDLKKLRNTVIQNGIALGGIKQ